MVGNDNVVLFPLWSGACDKVGDVGLLEIISVSGFDLLASFMTYSISSEQDSVWVGPAKC